MKLGAPHRILMTADPVGGVWVYALELARAFREQGIEVALATMGAALSREQRREVRLIDTVELFESKYKLEWMENPWDDLTKAGDWLLQLEQETSPDIIHLNGFVHGALSWRAPRIVVGHSCVWSWWRAVKGEWPATTDWGRYFELVSNGLRAADLVVAPSYAMLRQLREIYGIPGGRVIANGRDPSQFKSGRKEPFVFCAGRLWDEAKNISALAEVAKGLPWPVYVAGEQKRPSRHHMARSGLHFVGRIPSAQIAPWYGRASIYAHPARYEPFGLSVLEAGLAGCALVLGNIPSLREIWSGAAKFVAPDDPDELASAIGQWAENPAELREWASYAQCRAIQFTSNDMAQRYIAIYRELLATLPQRIQATEVLCAS